MKKNKIFPFDVDIEGPLGVLKGKIFKINSTGAIIEVFHSGFVAQSQVKLKFNLPFDNYHFDIVCKIMKTYNQHLGKKIQYFIEIHFLKLGIDQKDAIDIFIRKNNAIVKQGEEKLKEKNKDE